MAINESLGFLHPQLPRLARVLTAAGQTDGKYVIICLGRPGWCWVRGRGQGRVGPQTQAQACISNWQGPIQPAMLPFVRKTFNQSCQSLLTTNKQTKI